MKPILALACLLAAAPAPAQVKNPDNLTFLNIGDAESLDPAYAYDTASHLVIANVYEYLLSYKGGRKLELAPMLATAVPTAANGLLSKDGRTYRFPIRKGVRFHDGSPLTPEDVKHSLLRFMLLDRDGGPSVLLLEPLLGLQSTRDSAGKLLADVFDRADAAVRVEGEQVVLRLPKPYAPLPSILANFAAVVSKPWCAKNGDWDGSKASLAKHNNPRKEDSYLTERMNGTGAFKLERWDKRTKETVLARNDAYWRKPASLSRVFIKAIEEFATRKLMLQAGDADVIFAPSMMFPQVQGIPGVEIVDHLENLETPTMLLFTFKVNPVANPNVGSGRLDGAGIPPDFFSDKDVRKAIAHSIDYGTYIRDIARGRGWHVPGLIPKGLLGYSKDVKSYRFDLAKAAEHFRKAWGGKAWENGFQFTIMFNDKQPNILALSNMIKKNVESLNPKFKVDVRTVQWSTFLDLSQSRKVPLFVGAWMADFPDPHNFVFPLYHSSGYFPGKQGYASPEMDALIEAGVAETDPKKRAVLYKKIQDLAAEELSIIPVAQSVRYRTQRSWVKGFVFNPVFPDSPYGDYYYNIRKADK